MNLRPLLTLCAALLATPLSQAALFAVNGQMTDWGLQANGTAAGWTPTAGILYTVEDQTGSYLNPGYGGQAYDAEAMYLTWDKKADGNTYLYVGMVTGHNPTWTTGSGRYGAGDFAIDFGRDGSWDFGVVTRNHAGLQTGDVVRTPSNSNWAHGLWSAPNVLATAATPSPYVTHVNSGTGVGHATLAVAPIIGAMGTMGGDHWFYEVEIAVSAFDSFWGPNGPKSAFDVQWTMDCANDVITLDPPLRVPEPGTALLALLALGLLATTRRLPRI